MACTVSEASRSESPSGISDCSTCMDSEDCSSSDMDHTPCERQPVAKVDGQLARQAQPAPLANAVIIFDWDDTLFPTSYLNRESKNGSWPWPLTREDLRRHARLVECVLRAARLVARVSIVTLSGRPWVTQSAARRLPGLDFPALLSELGIDIFYAHEEGAHCPAAVALQDWKELKRWSMARCLDEHRVSGTFAVEFKLSVLSIGDAVIEQLALKELVAAWTVSPPSLSR